MTDDEIRERQHVLRRELQDLAREQTRRARRGWTPEQLHHVEGHPEWEYQTTRMAPGDVSRRPDGDGWVPNRHILGNEFRCKGDEFCDWEFWMRPRSGSCKGDING